MDGKLTPSFWFLCLLLGATAMCSGHERHSVVRSAWLPGKPQAAFFCLITESKSSDKANDTDLDH